MQQLEGFILFYYYSGSFCAILRGFLCNFKNMHFNLLQGRLQVARRHVGRSVFTDTVWAAAPPQLWSGITN